VLQDVGGMRVVVISSPGARSENGLVYQGGKRGFLLPACRAEWRGPGAAVVRPVPALARRFLRGSFRELLQGRYQNSKPGEGRSSCRPGEKICIGVPDAAR